MIMKRMKLISALMLALGLFMAVDGWAQPREDRREPDPERRIENLTKVLSLSSDQASEIRDVESNFMENMKALKDKGLSREEMRPEVKKLRDAKDTEYKDILTEDQYTKFVELRDSREQKGSRNGGPPKQRNR